MSLQRFCFQLRLVSRRMCNDNHDSGAIPQAARHQRALRHLQTLVLIQFALWIVELIPVVDVVIVVVVVNSQTNHPLPRFPSLSQAVCELAATGVTGRT